MRSRLLSSLFLVAAAGCSQRIDSPAPSVTSLMPKVVCDEQLTTRLSIGGDNMVPLPVRTLGGTGGAGQPTSLKLPAISFRQTGNLDGSAATGMALNVPDDLDHPETSRVHWINRTAMSVEVFPSLGLVDGTYDLTVTNADGQSATLSNALAAVPAPKITKVDPVSICDAQADQKVTITGTGLLDFAARPKVTITPMGGGMAKVYDVELTTGCVDVAKSVTIGVRECTGATFTIKRGDLSPGKYTLVLTNTEPAGCSTKEAIVITVNAPPKLSEVSPKTVCQGGGLIDVKGTGFQDKAKVSLGMSDATAVQVKGDTEALATFSGGNAMFTPGMSYAVTLTNPDGCSDSLAGAVTAVAGPVVFFADPPVVWNGMTTQVTLFATSIAPPVVVSMAPSGGGAPIMLSPATDPNHPKRVLVNIPKGTPAGTYDIAISDATGCPATLAKGLVVTATASVTLTGITPNFGWQSDTTPVVITASGGLMATPRVYLNPHVPGPNDRATALGSVAFISDKKVSAVVPKNVLPTPANYDVIVVNPDGTVGVIAMPAGALYQSAASPPPVIDAVTPGAVPNTNPPAVTITGTNFRTPAVSFSCITDTATGARMSFPATISGQPSQSSITVTPPVGNLTAPTLCTVRVTNGDDQTYFDYASLAVSNSSGNLSAPKAGTPLPSARRAPAVMGGFATRVNRFLYVAGGDSGSPAGALDTVVTVSTDEGGTGTQWFTQRNKLNAPRTLAGFASLGRYLYVVGGNDGKTPVKTVERAMVLDPQQAPVVADVDIVPGNGMGLGGGAWSYRISALMDPNDVDNPGGETLPSDVQSLLLPNLPQKAQVTLSWNPVGGAIGYRVYRTPMANQVAGQEQLLAEVMGGNTLDYTDAGGMTTATSPLPQGSTGRWRKLADLGFARESPSVAFGTDPIDPTKKYLYAALGRDQNAFASFEFLPVTINNRGQQVPANAWTAGTAMASAGRYQAAIYSADNGNCSFVPAGSNYIYLGGGTANGSSSVMSLEAAKVQQGGQLGAFASATNAGVKSFGSGFIAAANYLYTFGDEMPSTAIRAGQITMGSAPSVGNVNNNGPGMMTARYLPGTALQGALIYVVGGSDVMRTGATASVEWMIW